MPPHATWGYTVVPDAGTPEHALLTDFLVRKDWLPTS